MHEPWNILFHQNNGCISKQSIERLATLWDWTKISAGRFGPLLVYIMAHEYRDQNKYYKIYWLHHSNKNLFQSNNHWINN